MSDPRNTPPSKGPRGRQSLRKDVPVSSSRLHAVDEFQQQRTQSLGNASPQVQSSAQHSSNTTPSFTTPVKSFAPSNANRTSAGQSAKNKHYSDEDGLNDALPVPSVDGASPSHLTPQLGMAHPLSVPRHQSVTPARPEYAGPTFHASPAASALPMPKFFSKSFPTATPQSRLQARLDTEQEAEERENSEEKIVAVRERTDSPLDVFFNAQRMERARKISRAVPQTLAKPCREPSHSGKEIFIIEMDGTGDAAAEKLAITPFRERINAAKDEQQRLAQTRALKALLMTSHSEDLTGARVDLQTTSPPAMWPAMSGHPSDIPVELPASPSLYCERNQGARRKSHTQSHEGVQSSIDLTGPKSHGAAIALESACAMRDVKSMENDLRRLLKLDS